MNNLMGFFKAFNRWLRPEKSNLFRNLAVGEAHMLKNKRLFLGILACACLPYGAAVAFDESAVQTVRERPNADFTADGVAFRGFILRPSLSISEYYDDNIFRQADEEEDFVTLIEPEFRAETNWNLHQILAGWRGKYAIFSDFEDENYQDQMFFLSGRYDLGYETSVSGLLRADYLHEDRGDLDDVGGDRPIEFFRQTAQLAYKRAIGVLKLDLDGIYSSYQFDDSVASGVEIDNSVRDRDIFNYGGRLTYSLSDDYALFFRARGEKRTYDLDANAFRDSVGQEYALGAAVNFTGKFEVDAYLGYISQDYDGASQDDIKDIAYGGRLIWNYSDLTSITAKLDRYAVETIIADESGILRTDFDFNIDHAFRPNVIVGGNLGILNDEYEGEAAATDRDNVTYSVGFDVDYRLNPALHAGFDYRFLTRDFDTNSLDYDNQRIMLSLKVQY